MWSRCERWATYFVFGVGYRRTDHVYYFNSSGYWSRSSPLLVSRAPSVHLPLTHTPKLCPYLQSSEAQPSSHTSIRVTPGLASARLGYCRVIPATGLNWSEVVHEVGIFVNVGSFFFFLSKNTLCLTYSLTSTILTSRFTTAVEKYCVSVAGIYTQSSTDIYWTCGASACACHWDECRKDLMQYDSLKQVSLGNSGKRYLCAHFLNGQVNRTLFSRTFRKTEPSLRLIGYIGLLKNVLLKWYKSHVLFI